MFEVRSLRGRILPGGHHAARSAVPVPAGRDGPGIARRATDGRNFAAVLEVPGLWRFFVNR